MAGVYGSRVLPIYEDASGNRAVVHTEWVTLPSGLLIREQTDANGIPLRTSRVTSQLTHTPLAAGATYPQPWQDAQSLAVNYVAGSVYADQAGTLYIDFSDDGSNVYGTSATTLAFTPATPGTPNGQALPYAVEIPTRYFRFRYVNGTTAQGTFVLYQTPISEWSPRQIGLTGSLVPAATQDLVLVSDTLTSIPVGASYNTPTIPVLGYRFLAVSFGSLNNVSSTNLLTINVYANTASGRGLWYHNAATQLSSSAPNAPAYTLSAPFGAFYLVIGLYNSSSNSSAITFTDLVVTAE